MVMVVMATEPGGRRVLLQRLQSRCQLLLGQRPAAAG
jgi:hypothetical protein